MFFPPPSTPESEPPHGLKDATALVVQWLAEKKDVEVIQKRLSDLGLNKMEANKAIAAAVRMTAAPNAKQAPAPVPTPALEKRVLRETGRRNMVSGGVIFGIGLVAMLAMFALERGPNGVYKLAGAAMLFGGLQFGRGFLQTLD